MMDERGGKKLRRCVRFLWRDEKSETGREGEDAGGFGGPDEGCKDGGAGIFRKQSGGGVVEWLQEAARDIERRGEDEAVAENVAVGATTN